MGLPPLGDDCVSTLLMGLPSAQSPVKFAAQLMELLTLIWRRLCTNFADGIVLRSESGQVRCSTDGLSLLGDDCGPTLLMGLPTLRGLSSLPLR